MTVSSTIIKTSPFAGDGATVTFPFTWLVWESSEIKVILRLVSDGSETVLSEGTGAGNYSVTLSSDRPSAGSITTVTTYSSLYEIVIKSAFPQTQEVDYGEGDKFPAKSHEEAVDRGVRLSQQLQENFSRSLLFPETTILEDVELPEISSSLVGFFLGVNNAATGLEWGEVTDLGNLTAHNNAATAHAAGTESMDNAATAGINRHINGASHVVSGFSLLEEQSSPPVTAANEGAIFAQESPGAAETIPIFRAESNGATVAVLMGDADSKMWLFRNDAAPGMVIDANSASDTVLAFKGGSQAYNVNGGIIAGTEGLPARTSDTGPSTALINIAVTGAASAGDNTHEHTLNAESNYRIKASLGTMQNPDV